jgi:hypothetical protein
MRLAGKSQAIPIAVEMRIAPGTFGLQPEDVEAKAERWKCLEQFRKGGLRSGGAVAHKSPGQRLLGRAIERQRILNMGQFVRRRTDPLNEGRAVHLFRVD